MAWLVTVVARSRLVTFLCHVVLASAARHQHNFALQKNYSIPVSTSTCRLVRTVSSKVFNTPTGLAFAGFWLRTLPTRSVVVRIEPLTGTYLFFAVADTMSWLVTEEALHMVSVVKEKEGFQGNAP